MKKIWCQTKKINTFFAVIILCISNTDSFSQKVTPNGSVVVKDRMHKPFVFTKEMYKEGFTFTDKLDRKTSLEERLKLFNNYIAKRFGTTTVIDIKRLQNKLQNRYLSDNGSLSFLLSILKSKKKISEPVYQFYTMLDSKITSSKSYADGLIAIRSSQKEISSGKYNLSKSEANNLLAVLIYHEAFFEHQTETGGGTTALAGGNTFPCVSEHMEWESELCEAAFEGDEPYYHMSYSIVSEPCEGGGSGELPEDPTYSGPCTICPNNWIWEGAYNNWSPTYGYEISCRANFLAPRDPVTLQYSHIFVYNGAFYYTPVSGTNKCPAGGNFDGANCFYMAIPNGFLLARPENTSIPRLFRVLARCQ